MLEDSIRCDWWEVAFAINRDEQNLSCCGQRLVGEFIGLNEADVRQWSVALYGKIRWQIGAVVVYRAHEVLMISGSQRYGGRCMDY